MRSQPSAFIVEDDPLLSKVFYTALKADFDVESQSNGETAMQVLGESVPDLILLDLHLPGKSGKQILEYIRADDRFEKTKVILMTADSLLAYSLYSHADLVVLKPVSPMQLCESALKLFK